VDPTCSAIFIDGTHIFNKFPENSETIFVLLVSVCSIAIPQDASPFRKHLISDERISRNT